MALANEIIKDLEEKLRWCKIGFWELETRMRYYENRLMILEKKREMERKDRYFEDFICIPEVAEEIKKSIKDLAKMKIKDLVADIDDMIFLKDIFGEAIRDEATTLIGDMAMMIKDLVKKEIVDKIKSDISIYVIGEEIIQLLDTEILDLLIKKLKEKLSEIDIEDIIRRMIQRYIERNT